jgi:tetratricopeptide (TPR) repeat protein
MKDAGRFQQALPMIEKLIRILKDVHGGENHQRILACYDHLFQMQYKAGPYTEALLIVQKKVSIYKALNGADSVDTVFITYVIEMGLINYALRKFDDAIENWREAEKLTKKLSPADNPKEQEAQIQKFIQ